MKLTAPQPRTMLSSILKRLYWKTSALLLLSYGLILAFGTAVIAQEYTGGGIGAGVGAAGGIAGIAGGSMRQVIGNIVNTALNFSALLAVAVIVIAGFYLIFSMGDDTKRDTAKKIIIYTGAGLIVLLTAKIIVGFFLALPQ